ncbi:MAG: hypothetical protein PHQ27_06145 [Victivallales bacterium]|nr:hypothetical protein [Victivallales bacterium]
MFEKKRRITPYLHNTAPNGRPAGNRYCGRCFTLMELVVVMAIMTIIGGLAIGRLGKIPALASLEGAADRTERMFAYASLLAVTRGKTVAVVYDAAERRLRLAEPAAANTDADNRKYLNRRYGTITFNPGIALAWGKETAAATNPEFHFFPDGAASGPTLYLSRGPHAVSLRVSPLTGVVIRGEVQP